jgi:hypothetical protein
VLPGPIGVVVHERNARSGIANILEGEIVERRHDSPQPRVFLKPVKWRLRKPA